MASLSNYLPSLPVVARLGVAPTSVGLLAGLTGWWFSEQILPFLNNNRWTIPVGASLSGFAVMFIVMLYR
jgi:hypothetical protein